MELARIGLDDGGSILVEATAENEGPVKAGRIGAAIAELPVSLSAALEPVIEVAGTVLGQLRKAGPAKVEVEFGVDLAVQAGVVITKTAANSHLKVTLTWKRAVDEPDGK